MVLRDVARATERSSGLLARMRYSASTWLGQHPVLYLPLARISHRRALNALGPGADPDAVPPVVDTDADIVIEGYPRSANSFAVAAFRLAQERPVNIAHHRHVAAQVLGSIKLGVPTLVLIRAPEEAVPSLVARHPHVGMRGALLGYVRFYRPLIRHRTHIEWATFSEVTSDFGAVIRRINARYGTNFHPFEHTKANVLKCFDAIDQHDRETLGGDFDVLGARPSQARPLLKDALMAEYGSKHLKRLRVRAGKVYATLVGTRNSI
jgi:hypothetical protein